MISIYVRLRSFLVRSRKTAERLKRTLLQVAAGGALGGVFSALVLGREAMDALIAASATAAGAFVAAWAQNTLEDIRPEKDQRPEGD